MIPDNFDYFDMWEQEQARQEKLRLKEEEWERSMDDDGYYMETTGFLYGN